MRWLRWIFTILVLVAGLLIWAYWDEEPNCQIRMIQIGNAQYPNCFPIPKEEK